MKNEVMKVFNTYTEALSKGDFGEVFKTISDDIIWHMGGRKFTFWCNSRKTGIRRAFE